MEFPGAGTEPLVGDRGRLRARAVPLATLCAVCVLSGLLITPAAQALVTSQSFTYTGEEQTFTVPAGVSSLEVVAVGGHGGNASEPGGDAAEVSGEVSVTPGETLFVEVGGNGTPGYDGGGFNGGGGAYGGAGIGGGASDVRTSPLAAGLSPDGRLLVAGGGGGGGNTSPGLEGICISGPGGAAGETGEGSSCGASGGGPGTQTSGGAAGETTTGARPLPGQLGVGGHGGSDIYGGGAGGAGGGGYYGGGGGGDDWGSGGGGGGGGSSLVPAGGSVALAPPNVQPQVQISYPPVAVTGPASAVARTSASLNATVDPGGEAVTDCRFEYGTSPAYGSSVPCASLPGSGTSPVAVSAAVTRLSVDTTYYYRIAATNGVGTGYGIEQTFSTLPNPPAVLTEAPSEVAQTLATLNGTVNPEGGSVSDCHFEYGTSPSFGSSAPCSSLPGSGSSPVAAAASVTGLEVDTAYYYRIVATNSGGTSYGSLLTFSTHVNTRAYTYTGAEQTFTVPAGVYSLRVLAAGGRGGDTPGREELAGAGGGVGAQVSGDVSVTPRETLYVEVGGNGSNGADDGGFNGGGNGSQGKGRRPPPPYGGGGGGASDVRTSPLAAGLSPDDRLLVAGGGGGASSAGGSEYPGRPGANAGEGPAGKGGGGAGTQSGGGAGGGEGKNTHPGEAEVLCAGRAGQLGMGGEARERGEIGGGGGGGGYYGGGAGRCLQDSWGGGGGSSLVPAGGSVVVASANTQPQVRITPLKIITGTQNGKLTVRAGATVELTSTAKINGPVTVEEGGELEAEPKASISGPLKANKAALLRLCGAMIAGPVKAIDGPGPVVIGEGIPRCPANDITGPVTVMGHTGGVLIDGNVVTGPLSVTGNEGGTTVVHNSVSEPLTVMGNGPPVVDRPNEVTAPSELQQ